ncbi:unnamed protein product [Ilex paraguariensis]|uniref:Pectinesterase inhibitor domain-containing protein n=1 Tax=Ilex paraguariensis TaxID=185542 RepID=A0ABC8SLT2_9AQUA
MEYPSLLDPERPYWRKSKRPSMASKTQNSLSLVSLAIVTLVFATNAHQQPDSVNPFCNTATDKAFCTALVHEAKTWNEATMNAITGTLERATRVKKIVDGLNSALPSVKKDSKELILSTCSESYQYMLDNLHGALEDLKSGDKVSLNEKLSSASFSDCTNGLKQFHIASPLASFNDELLKFIDNCLAVSRQV